MLARPARRQAKGWKGSRSSPPRSDRKACRRADPQYREEDLDMKAEMMTNSDICALCGGKLQERFTELVLEVGDELAERFYHLKKRFWIPAYYIAIVYHWLG